MAAGYADCAIPRATTDVPVVPYAPSTTSPTLLATVRFIHKSHHPARHGPHVVNPIGAQEQILAKAVKRTAPNAMAMARTAWA